MRGKPISWIKIVFAILLLVGLPVFIWAVLTQRIELRKRATDITTVCWNRVSSESGTLTDVWNYYWPSSCKGNISTDSACASIHVPLTPDELNGYHAWVASGSAAISGCNGAPSSNGCYVLQTYPPQTVCPSGTPTPRPPTPTPSCTREVPVVTVSPTIQSGDPGATLTYVATITNTDAYGCGSSQFALSNQVPTGFVAHSPSAIDLPAGATTNISFTVTSPITNPDTTPQTVPISFTATSTASSLSRTVNVAYTFLAPQPQPMKFRIKLAGVTGAEAVAKTITIRFYLQDGRIMEFLTPLTLSYLGDGIYEAGGTLTNPLPANTAFSIGVKGEKHLRLRFCQYSGQTDPCVYGQTMTHFQATPVTFDFTGRPLPAGDLNKDNQISAADITLMTDIFKKTSSQITPEDKVVADVNYDGYVDNFDLNLLLQSLSTRYDE